MTAPAVDLLALAKKAGARLGSKRLLPIVVSDERGRSVRVCANRLTRMRKHLSRERLQAATWHIGTARTVELPYEVEALCVRWNLGGCVGGYDFFAVR